MYCWEIFKHWFLSLGKKYGVDLFFCKYLPWGHTLFFLCLAWAITNISNKKPFVLPAYYLILPYLSLFVFNYMSEEKFQDGFTFLLR